MWVLEKTISLEGEVLFFIKKPDKTEESKNTTSN